MLAQLRIKREGCPLYRQVLHGFGLLGKIMLKHLIRGGELPGREVSNAWGWLHTDRGTRVAS